MGRKTRNQKQKLVAEINITPFTDVILVLLVIFMITTPLMYQTSIEIRLPEVTNTKPTKSVNRVDVSVTDSGAIYMDKEMVSEKELKERVDTVHRKNPDINIFLRADKSAKFKYVVRILDMLVEAGIKNLNIAAMTEQQQ